ALDRKELNLVEIGLVAEIAVEPGQFVDLSIDRLRQTEWPGADDLTLHALPLGIERLTHFLRNDDVVRVADHEQEIGLRLGQTDHHRERTARLDRGDVSEQALAWTDDAARRFAEPVEAIDDVFGGQRRSVMEHDAAVEVERHRLA